MGLTGVVISWAGGWRPWRSLCGARPLVQPSALFSSLQLGANALLFLGVNMYGVFVRILAERAQRKAFLQARNCIEDRLRLEDENEKQVSAQGLSQRGVGGPGSGDGALQSSTPRALGVGPALLT